MIPAWVGPAVSIASGLFSAFGDDNEDPMLKYADRWQKNTRTGMGEALEILRDGRARLDPMWTPYGPTPYLSDAGRPEAANLGMGAYMQGGGAFDTLTDPRMMLDVASNPYVMNMANTAANEAQRRVAAGFAGNSYGGSAQLKATTGAVSDAMNKVLGDAYSRGLQAMSGALTMTPEMTQLPLEQMDAYQMGDWDWLDRYMENMRYAPTGMGSTESAGPLEKFGAGMEAGAGLFDKITGLFK